MIEVIAMTALNTLIEFFNALRSSVEQSEVMKIDVILTSDGFHLHPTTQSDSSSFASLSSRIFARLEHWKRLSTSRLMLLIGTLRLSLLCSMRLGFVRAGKLHKNNNVYHIFLFA